jgi:hypothetical protein
MPAFVHIPRLNSPLFRGRGKRVRLQSISARETCRNPVIEGDVGAFNSKHCTFIQDWLQAQFFAQWPAR